MKEKDINNLSNPDNRSQTIYTKSFRSRFLGASGNNCRSQKSLEIQGFCGFRCYQNRLLTRI